MIKAMKKGINAWCFPGSFSIRRCMELAKQAGFDSIELNMSEENKAKGLTDELSFEENPGLTLDTTDDGLRAIAALAKEIGIEISSVSTGLHWTYPLTSDDAAVREKGKLVVRKMIHAAKLFGADAILVVPGLVDKTVSYTAAYRRSLEAFRELAETAEREKVFICAENVWNKFLLSPMEMARFVDEVGSPYVGVYFDAGNVLQFSYPEHWVEALGGRIRRIHIKDFNVSVGNIQGFVNLLEGDMDWPALMKSLKAVGYDGYITAELSPYKIGPEQIAADTSRHMDAIFGRA
jgi:hexulose-6-phosphate isomerase